jgi:periplasmic divalent cation tolerance protein
MGSDSKFRIVLVTCGTLSEARRIAHSVVKRRLAACVNISRDKVESVYRWKNKIETAKEYLLIIKTSSARLKELEGLVKHLHSYDVPEFIVLPIVTGSAAYLEWVAENTTAPKRRKAKKR